MIDNLNRHINPYYAEKDGDTWQVIEQNVTSLGEMKVIETGLDHVQAERLAEKWNKAFHNKWSVGKTRRGKNDTGTKRTSRPHSA